MRLIRACTLTFTTQGRSWPHLMSGAGKALQSEQGLKEVFFSLAEKITVNEREKAIGFLDEVTRKRVTLSPSYLVIYR